jgi:hypothetical protein
MVNHEEKVVTVDCMSGMWNWRPVPGHAAFHAGCPDCLPRLRTSDRHTHFARDARLPEVRVCCTIHCCSCGCFFFCWSARIGCSCRCCSQASQRCMWAPSCGSMPGMFAWKKVVLNLTARKRHSGDACDSRPTRPRTAGFPAQLAPRKAACTGTGFSGASAGNRENVRGDRSAVSRCDANWTHHAGNTERGPHRRSKAVVRK